MMEDTMLSSVTRRLGEEISASVGDGELLVRAVLDALGQAESLGDLVDRVTHETSLPRGKALELSQMTCRFLAEELDEAALAHVQNWLPGDVLALFDRTAPLPDLPPRRHHPPRRDQTLASGRSGSRHPVSEAVPGHRESVAASPEPHADTKLSSSRGTSTERGGDTLATGRSGSRRPLSESED
jgi:hypothetical protein